MDWCDPWPYCRIYLDNLMACTQCERLSSQLSQNELEQRIYREGAESRIRQQDSWIAGLRQELLESESDCSALIGQLAAKDQEIERLKANDDLRMDRPQGFNTTHIGE